MAHPVTLLRLPPMKFHPSTDDVASMSTAKKFEEMIRRAADRVPEQLKGAVLNMISPSNLAICVGTLSLWAASHFCGVGEVVDIILLGMGFAITGVAFWDAANDIAQAIVITRDAKSQTELNQAAEHFARGITSETIVIISAWLLGRQLPSAVKNFKNAPLRIRLENPGAPPPPGTPKIRWRPDFPAGKGQTSWYGNISISTEGTMVEELLAFYHEQAHSFLMPRFGPLRELQAGLRASSYVRSAVLRYMEEMFCEMYAQFRVFGITTDTIRAGFTFPVARGYVTVSQLVVEGTNIGSILVESQLFQVYLWEKQQQIPASLAPDYSAMVCE